MDAPTPNPAASQRTNAVALNNPEHTRVPNLIFDLIIFRLTPGEQACLLYILRKTYGFASPTVRGQRKQWDRISLSQFIDGTNSGKYVLDSGCGLTKGSVIRSLGKLEERDLIRVSYECPTAITKQGKRVGCGWNQVDDDLSAKPVIDPKTNAHRCPRCGRTLSKSYGLRTLTPGWVKRFLTSTDPNGRVWHYDPEVQRFWPQTPEQAEQAAQDDAAQQRQTTEALRQQLWFPDLTDKIVGHAIGRLKSGKMAESRLIGGFYKPILEMQSQFPKHALRYGLEEAVKRKVAAGPGSDQRWQNYVKVCIKSHLERSTGGRENAERSQQTHAIETMLSRCAELNAEQRPEQAKQKLKALLDAHLDEITAEFDGDRPLARRHVLESFKRGLTDYRYVRNYTSRTDYLPEWTWEADEARTR